MIGAAATPISTLMFPSDRKCSANTRWCLVTRHSHQISNSAMPDFKTHTPAVSWMKSANMFATLFISLQICSCKESRVKGTTWAGLNHFLKCDRCLSHLSLYCQFDCEGDKISEELFEPVWSGQNKETQITDLLLLPTSRVLRHKPELTYSLSPCRWRRSLWNLR